MSLVQDVEVVAVDVAVERDLPVGPDQDAFVEEFHVGEPELIERDVIAAEPAVEVELSAGTRDDEHQAAAFLTRQLGEAARVGVDVAELVAPGNPHQGTFGVVAPCVVRAGEPARLAAPFADHECAPVPAGVDERLDRAVGLTDRQDRNTCDVDRPVRAGLGQVRAHG